MRHRGRKSAAELQIADAARHLVQRPTPPSDLTDLQRMHWMQITNALPADWFADENRALLGMYVRTLSSMAHLDSQINALEEKQEVVSGLYIELLKRREALTRLCLTQATKMRLTQQSRYKPDVAATATTVPRSGIGTKLWEFE